uniref:Uncharacterized protein n=1 Tax=Geobacter sp. (strain M21) TaxID=443144 RepID=C6E5V2_GEOSM
MKQSYPSLKIWVGLLLFLAIALAVSYPQGGKLWRNLATPLAGEKEVLPLEAQFLLDLVRRNGVRSVTLSKRLFKNRFLAQPMTESIYPAVVKDGGELYVYFASEPLPGGCEFLQTVKGVSIASCR